MLRVILSGGASAQEALSQSEETLALTLAEAVQRAVDLNPDFSLLAAQIQQQEAGVRILLARLLPAAVLTGAYTHTDQEVVFGSSVVVDQDSFDLRGNLSVSLFQPRALSDYLTATRELEAARAQSEFTRDTLVLAVIEVYMGLARADAQLTAAQAALERRTAFLEAAQARLTYELADRSEVQRARLSLLAAQTGRDQALSQLHLAEEALVVILDLPEGTRVGLEGTAQPPLITTTDADSEPPGAMDSLCDEEPAPNTATDRDGATSESAGSGIEGESSAATRDSSRSAGWSAEQRADVQAERLLQERDEIAERFTWLDFLPDLELGASFTQGPSTFRDPDGFSWQIDLTATFLLYDGGARYGIMHREEATRALHAAQLESTEAQARSEVRSAALRVQARQQELETASESLAIAQEYYADAIRRRDAGLVSLLQVLDAEEQLSDAELQVQVLQQDLCLEQWHLWYARGELASVFGL